MSEFTLSVSLVVCFKMYLHERQNNVMEQCPGANILNSFLQLPRLKHKQDIWKQTALFALNGFWKQFNWFNLPTLWSPSFPNFVHISPYTVHVLSLTLTASGISSECWMAIFSHTPRLLSDFQCSRESKSFLKHYNNVISNPWIGDSSKGKSLPQDKQSKYCIKKL